MPATPSLRRCRFTNVPSPWPNWRVQSPQTSRLSSRERRQDTSSITDQPAILVPGAFQSGGAQVSLHRRDFLVDAEDIVTWSHGMHTLRFGGGARPRWIRAMDASNFGGTFIFSCLFSTPTTPCPFAFSQNSPA